KCGALKSGNGQAVSLTWQIEEGEFEDRRIFDQLIIQHTNETAMRLGRGRLKDICAAVGATGALTDLAAICHKPGLGKGGVEVDESGPYPGKKRCKKVKPLKENVVPLKATGTGGPTYMSGGKETKNDPNYEIPF